MPLEEIAKQVHLSKTPCWRRIRKMEDDGIIEGRTALVSPEKVGLSMTIFIAVRTQHHDTDWMETFATAVRDTPEIMEAYRLAGTIDYLLKVVVADTAAFDDFYKRLIDRISLSDVNSMVGMERIKSSPCLPI